MLNACKKIIKTLNENGFEAYMVGGFVRDYLLKIDYNDIDIATNALPSDVLRLFKSIPVGIKYGTVLVIMDGFQFEVTTYRIDGEYNDSRHPDKVTFSKNLEEDLKRRDFTINALALDKDMNLIDLFGGSNDLNNKCIKAVGNPDLRFKEDALRILRAFYFVSKLGFKIEKKTEESMINNQNNLKDISIERVQNELQKITSHKYKDKAFEIMKKYDIFKHYGLSFNYEIDDILDLYIISFYMNKSIPDIYHLAKNDKKNINNAIEIINSIIDYDRYQHYLYRDLYERCVKIYNRINNKDIRILNEPFCINCLKELDISSNDLSELMIEKKYHSIILKEIEKRVVLGNIINSKTILKAVAIKVYNNIRS